MSASTPFMKLGWIIALPALLISLHGAEETYPHSTTKTKSLNEAIDAGCEFLKEKQFRKGLGLLLLSFLMFGTSTSFALLLLAWAIGMIVKSKTFKDMTE